VVRRQNTNGAWAKSRHSRIVPVDSLVVYAHDQYFTERAMNPAAGESDFVFVNLFRTPMGAPMTPLR
jgi:site-specific recombinase XerD